MGKTDWVNRLCFTVQGLLQGWADRRQPGGQNPSNDKAVWVGGFVQSRNHLADVRTISFGSHTNCQRGEQKL